MLNLSLLTTANLIKLILLSLLAFFSLLHSPRGVLALELSLKMLNIGQKLDCRMTDDKEELGVVHVCHVLSQGSSAESLGILFIRINLIETLGQVVNEALCVFW